MSTSLTFAGWWDGMYYQDSSLSLEDMLLTVKSQEIKDSITKNFDQIASSSVSEDYQYNALNFDTRKIDYNVFITSDIQSRVTKVSVYLKPSYDMMQTYGKLSVGSISANSDYVITPREQNGDYETGSVTLGRSELTVWESGGSYSMRAAVVFDDGSIVPYSMEWFIYLQPNTIEGIKNDLSSAYYTGLINYSYPDTSRLLKVAFEKLEIQSWDLDTYLANLEIVRLKAIALWETQNKSLEEIAAKVNNQESFEANTMTYGEAQQKFNIINEIAYQIGTEIETRKYTDFINEIFTAID